MNCLSEEPMDRLECFNFNFNKNKNELFVGSNDRPFRMCQL